MLYVSLFSFSLFYFLVERGTLRAKLKVSWIPNIRIKRRAWGALSFALELFFHRQCVLVKLAIGEIISQHKINRINGALPERDVASFIACSHEPNGQAKWTAVTSGASTYFRDAHASPAAGTRQRRSLRYTLPLQPSWKKYGALKACFCLRGLM